MALTQPKKPVGGAFGVFANEKRPEFMKACAGERASAVSKMAGEEWKKLSEEQKQPYQKKYEDAKAQFEKDMAAFIASGGEKAKGLRALRTEKKAAKDGKKVKKARDADAPKKPVGGAYGCFLADKREEIKKSLPTDHKITDVAKKAGELWKSLPESEKEKYNATFKTVQEQYAKEFEVYKAQKKADEPEEAEASTPEKAKKPKANADSGKKRKAAESKAANEKPAKRGRKVATPMSKSTPGIELSDAILAQARTAGYESQLKNLASRTDVVTSGKNANELLKALQASNGLVNPAKRALLGE